MCEEGDLANYPESFSWEPLALIDKGEKGQNRAGVGFWGSFSLTLWMLLDVKGLRGVEQQQVL